MSKTRPFRQLADPVDAVPRRRARVEQHKAAMLADLQRQPVFGTPDASGDFRAERV